MEVFISEKTGCHVIHIEQVPSVIEVMQTLCDNQLVSSATLTARSDHEKHACLLEEMKQNRDMFSHFHSKKCNTNKVRDCVASQCLTTASTELNLEELQSAVEALKCNPDEVIGLKWCNDEALSTASVMPFTAQVQLVTLKNRIIMRAFPVYAENARFALPRCECTRDMWRAPLVLNKTLLSRFLKVASLHRESEGQIVNDNVKLSCVRACACSDSYNDL